MQQLQGFEVAQAAGTVRDLAADHAFEAPALAAEAGEGAHQADILHHVHQFAIHRRGLGGIGQVQRLPVCCEPRDAAAKQRRGQEQRAGHGGIDAGQQRDGEAGGNRRRQGVPGEVVQDGVGGVRRGRDPAGQHAGRAPGEEGRRMATEVAEQVGAQVRGDGGKGAGSDPAADAP